MYQEIPRFRPTPEQSRKYADYSFEVVDTGSAVEIWIENGRVYREYALVYRIPSLKKFKVFVYRGADEVECEIAERAAKVLSRGGWARYGASSWRRYKCSKTQRIYFQQCWLRGADDPMPQLELEMMIDTELLPN